MKLTIRLIIIFLLLNIVLGAGFYFLQEKLIFYPSRLDKNYAYCFDQPFEELYIPTKDGKQLNALLFRSDSAKGLILYVHGNAGALDSWGGLASFYTGLGYDVLFFDYRGYGKSEGSIGSQEQLFDDVQSVYDKMAQQYAEDKIVVLGFSIGTCPAAKLACDNNPRMLILQAPYHDLTGVIKDICPIIPSFLIRYKMETYKYVQKTKAPIVIFHGNQDNVIAYSNSEKLSKELKDSDVFITLDGIGHRGITENGVYREKLSKILE